MSKSIFLRRAVFIPDAGVEYVLNWEQDTVVPLCASDLTKVAMFTNGASRIAISVASNAGNLENGTVVRTYVDPISCNLWDDFMDAGKIVNQNVYAALTQIVVVPQQVFLQAPCAFETMKLAIIVPNPIFIIVSVIGWNGVSDQ